MKPMYSYHPSLFSAQIFHTLNTLEEQTVNLLLALVFSSTFQFRGKKKIKKKINLCSSIHLFSSSKSGFSLSYYSN